MRMFMCHFVLCQIAEVVIQGHILAVIASPKNRTRSKEFITNFGHDSVLGHPFQCSLLDFLRKNKENWMKSQPRGRRKANRKTRDLGTRRRSYMVMYFLCFFTFLISFQIFTVFSSIHTVSTAFINRLL